MTDLRHARFVCESNAIEGMKIVWNGNGGHAAALAEAVVIGGGRGELTVEAISRWQAAILGEQLDSGYTAPDGAAGRIRSQAFPIDVRIGEYVAPRHDEVPALLETWMTWLNGELRSVGRFLADSAFVTILGDGLQRFEAIHPFADGNGRVGRLCCAFIAAWCGRPIPIVRAGDRDAFFAAHRSRLAMRIYLAEIVRETINWPGRGTLERQQRNENSDVFDGVVIERHELQKALMAWKHELHLGTPSPGSRGE